MATAEQVDATLAVLQASGAVTGVDLACSRAALLELSAEQLQALGAAGPTSDDPAVLPGIAALLPCLSGTVATPGAAASVDPCTLATAGDLAVLDDSLGAGELGNITDLVLGEGAQCRFPGSASSFVSVSVYEAADLASWHEERGNGDGTSDGDPLPGFDDGAYLTWGGAEAAVGDTVVSVSAFPSFEVTTQALMAALSVVVDSLTEGS